MPIAPSRAPPSPALLLLAVLLPGCAADAPQAGDAVEVGVVTAYDPALSAPGDAGAGPPPGSPASRGTLLVHVVPAEAWPEYRAFADSGLADWPQPEAAREGDLLAPGEDGGSARYAVPLDDAGRASFRVPEGVWLRVELSGGRAVDASCEGHLRNGPPQDRRVAGPMELSLAFGVECSR